jgi:hypothetical protein
VVRDETFHLSVVKKKAGNPCSHCGVIMPKGYASLLTLALDEDTVEGATIVTQQLTGSYHVACLKAVRPTVDPSLVRKDIMQKFGTVGFAAQEEISKVFPLKSTRG